MTAKSKRPFYVFAAVAFLCCMVMVAGVRGSRADDGRSPLLAGPRILDRAPTLIPSTDGPGPVTADGDPGATGGTGPGGSDESTPDLGRPPLESDIGGPEAPEVPQSGVGVLAPPDFVTPPEASDPGVTPPVTDDEPGTKGRGHKKGKDKGKDKNGQGGPPGPETPPTGPPTNPVTPETETETESGDAEPGSDPTP